MDRQAKRRYSGPGGLHTTENILHPSGDELFQVFVTEVVLQYWMWGFLGPLNNHVTSMVTAAGWCGGVVQLNNAGHVAVWMD